MRIVIAVSELFSSPLLHGVPFRPSLTSHLLPDWHFVWGKKNLHFPIQIVPPSTGRILTVD